MNHRYILKTFLLMVLLFGLQCFVYAQNKQVEATIGGKPDTALSKVTGKNDVNTAYSTQKAKHIVESISTVSGHDIRKTFNTNLGNILIGRMAGLTVTPGSNEPGINTPNLYSRGLSTTATGNALGTSTTVGSSTAPLIILDGFISDYTPILPEEIEQVSLLKDAAATAVYGMRAANGVLLITTKRGSKSPLKVGISTQQGFSQALSLPTFLDSYGYASLYNEALSNDNKARKYNSNDLDAYLNNTDPLFHPNVNWYDQVLRKNAPLANYNLTFSGGNDAVKYFVLVNYINQGGLYQNFGDQDTQSSNSTYDRTNFRTNIDVTLTKNLTAALTLGGTIENKANPAGYNTSGVFSYLASLPPNSFPVYNADGSFSAISTSITNPVANLLKTGFYSTNGRTLESSLRLTQRLDMLTPGLSLSAALSTYSFFTSYSNKTRQVQTFFLAPTGALSAIGVNTSLVGSESQSDQYRNTAIQTQINYERKFGKHAISMYHVFNSDDYTVSYAASTIDGLTSQPYKHNSLSGKFNYEFNDKYIGEFAYAYMGSNDFGPGKRYGFFPAGAIGWVVSNESFLKNNPVISFLKLRASYGVVGNDNINAARRYLFDQYVNYTSQVYFGTGGSSAFAYAQQAFNTDITWEKQKTTNIGFDATIFKNVSLTIDYFKNDRYDILVSPANVIPQYLGSPIAALNQGKVSNKGVETTIGYSSDLSRPAKFYVAANVSYAKNKIVYNAEAYQVNSYQLQAGSSIGLIRGYVATGFYSSADEIQNSAKLAGVSLQPGDIKYQDIGGPKGVPDGIIDQYDSKVIGKSSIPEWTAGLNVGGSYKLFDVNFVIQGVTGRSVYTNNAYTRAFQGTPSQVNAIALDRWTPATASSATYPRLSTDGNQNNYAVSSFWVKNGEFLKMRSAEIGFTFPKRLINKIKLSSARLFIQGTNLFSLDHMGKYGGDPETLTGYPVLRTFSLGAKVQLN